MSSRNQATHEEGSHHNTTGLEEHDQLGLTLHF